jgi:adenylosuccinate lyase
LCFYEEFRRALRRLKDVREDIATCMISGPVGNFVALSPKVEEFVAKKLGLKPEICSTQVITRDRYAYFFSVLGVLASSIEHFAMEIRHLQRREVLEVEEGFSSKQKGSSAMPHKKNPILSENLTGLSRIIRSYVIPSMENVALLHERDISHSSVERVITPDACILTDFALFRLNELINNLVIRPENMEKNMNLLGDMYRSHISLLALIKLGLSRDDAYLIIQKNSMQVWNKSRVSLLDAMRNDSELLAIINTSNVREEEFFDSIESCNYLKYVDDVFSRVLKK